MDAILPAHSGLLPNYLIYVGVAALIHTAVTYLKSPTASLCQFLGPRAPPPTALLAHVYGVQNIYTALIQFYNAYHINNPQLYVLAMWTFAGTLFLNGSEMVVWNTVRMKEFIFIPLTAGTGLVWMLQQWAITLFKITGYDGENIRSSAVVIETSMLRLVLRRESSYIK